MIEVIENHIHLESKQHFEIIIMLWQFVNCMSYELLKLILKFPRMKHENML